MARTAIQLIVYRSDRLCVHARYDGFAAVAFRIPLGANLLDYAPRILIVDDEPMVRVFFDQILSGDGYFVASAGTVRQALRAIADKAFELVLVDLSLPDGDGLDLVRQMRVELPYLKILATSGFLVGNMPEVAIAAGATATLSKPTTASKLRYAVYRLLEPSGQWCGAS